MKKPLFLVFPITYTCNCRCRMCTIWERQASVPDIPLDRLETLFSEPILADNIRHVNLTGGEPFLRKDLVELSRMFARRCTRMETFTLASNGMVPELIHDRSEEILSLLPPGVNSYWSFSLDGPRDTHDLIRGREGCFDKLMRTIELIRPFREKYPTFSFGFNATISRFNFRQVEEIQKVADDLGVGVGYTTANVVDTFIGSAASQHDFALREEEKAELVTFFQSLNNRYPNPYWEMVVHMLQGGQRTQSCLARQQGVLLDGDGAVYHCGQSSELFLGNIYEQTFEEIWNGARARDVARRISRECDVCLTNCYPARKWRDQLRDILRR